MKERRRRRPEGRRGPVEAATFMDTVRMAFVRATALSRYRDVEDVQASLGCDLARATAECEAFPTRGRYRALWETRWRDVAVPAAATGEAGALFAAIESALRGALDEEIAARAAAGDAAIDEDPEYKRFVDRALERLLGESAGAFESS